ncbi:MAG: Asp-tRNA(Asn)/Glu-tRNA(Gln) amidotransferase subunit GatA [Desulfuromonadaceae bacterium]|nr:Asp-tRNA(Asn)/Glu-tRNA(Gln) amidotransferase subunit GatA [Desulfuromonadaceae bacterium]
MSLTDLTLRELHDKLRTKELSSVEVTRAYLERIAAHNAALNIYLTERPVEALRDAEAADRRIAAGEAAPLTGIPLALKDLLVTEGIRTTCGSKILENFIPPYNGTAVHKLRDSGAVLLGKLNMDEFGMGSSNENSAFGPCCNPWDRERVAGGSSGGSAACIAARLAVASLGTDTGGSIRQPASHCGAVGLKPTYGRVSRYGVVAYASSLDQVGPMTRTVEDSALLLQTIAGYDRADSTSIDCPVPDYRAALRNDLKGVRVGLPKEYFIDGLDPAVQRTVASAIDVLRDLGAEIVHVSLPHTDYAVACYYLIATAEASSNLARYDGVRYGRRVTGEGGLIEMYNRTRGAGFGDEVKRRIMLGTYALSSGYYDAYYLKAQKVRTLIRQDFLDVFAQVDVLATPVAPTPAFRLGEKGADPLQMYLSDIFTIPVNLAGTCGLSLPCGFATGKLPIGLQLIGKPFGEDALLGVGHAYQQATDWHKQQAEL